MLNEGSNSQDLYLKYPEKKADLTVKVIDPCAFRAARFLVRWRPTASGHSMEYRRLKPIRLLRKPSDSTRTRSYALPIPNEGFFSTLLDHNQAPYKPLIER